MWGLIMLSGWTVFCVAENNTQPICTSTRAGAGAAGAAGCRAVAHHLALHPAPARHPAPGHGECGLGVVWVLGVRVLCVEV